MLKNINNFTLHFFGIKANIKLHNMLRNLLLTMGIILASSMLVFSQSGTLKGKILDKDTGEPIPFANVVIELGGSQLGGTTSDFDGNYTIKPITPGKYNVRATYVSYQAVQVNDVIISADKITFLDLKMSNQAQNLEEVVISGYKVPLISKDKTTSGGTVTSEEIEKMPNKSADAIAATVGGVFSQDGTVESIRGQRSEGTVYYIDGIKVTGSANLPQSAIDQVSVVLGGVPAQYGDATGGIINITTKGPSRKFGGGISAQTSEFLDDFGYNRIGVNLNGPLLKKKDGNSTTSIIGYYLAGEATFKEDGRPTATGVYKVKDSVYQAISATPIIIDAENGSYTNASSYLHADDFEHMAATQNTDRTEINLSSKIDIKTTPTVNLTIGGNYSYRDVLGFNYSNSVFNWENNAQYITNTSRAFVRFTNRFKNENKDALIKNTFISFQADFQRVNQITQNPNFEDNLFEYGYVGKFTTYKERNYSDEMEVYNEDGDMAYVMNNWADTLVTFSPGTSNPVLANYTSAVYNAYSSADGYYDNTDNILASGGLLNSSSPESVYSLWNNVGDGQLGYDYSEYNVDQTSFDLKVSTDIGDHEVRFGMIYEQKKESYYGYDAEQLWSTMRQLANSHIEQLDLDNPIEVYQDGFFMDTVNYARLYDGESQRYFDTQLRQAMGLDVNGTEWIDIDSYDMDNRTISYYDDNGDRHTATLDRDLSIDMFSAEELLNSGGYTAYAYGFDYSGNKLSSQPSFSDFFNDTDDDGEFTRNVGAFEPIYTAGYIQDKFAFKDLIFNIGVRIDRFDANQMVLSDPYLLYPSYTAGELRSNANLLDADIPTSIGDNYVVYVNDYEDPSSITGYRSGSVWYDADGQEVSDPETSLAGSNGGVQPYIIDADNLEVNEDAFKDYEPQISVMPRVAFSFPISDEALFFAHYDVLTQRPRTGLRMDPRTYYYMPSNTGSTDTYNNPNLKPEKTIDYELGFQQKISNTSSMIISAFYREIRDQIQSYRFTAAYPSTYYSYNNIDFGTVKGLTLTYDLRRTKNIRLKTSYTLQFAEGTGSDASTAKSLILSGQPNLRNLLPLDIDRRHAINLMLDYRFGEGKDYNGPTSTRSIEGSDKVKTIQWFKNTGINFTLNGGSGTPYTKSSRIYSVTSSGRVIEGSINGARKPSTFRIDMRLDRDIELKFGEDKKKSAFLNVYLEVLNLLNTENVLNVYSATGNADDDGYLAAEEWQSVIDSRLDSEAFRTMYWMYLQSPYNYSAPRQIRLGINLNF